MNSIDVVRRAVAAAYKKAWGRNISAATIRDAVLAPDDTRRSGEDGIIGSEAVVFTEYAGLSQYDNDQFWAELRRELRPHGLYYEWLDGGTATIWPTDPPVSGRVGGNADRTLRSRIIRLAAARPELRGDLLPLVAGDGRTAASFANHDLRHIASFIKAYAAARAPNLNVSVTSGGHRQNFEHTIKVDGLEVGRVVEYRGEYEGWQPGHYWIDGKQFEFSQHTGKMTPSGDLAARRHLIKYLDRILRPPETRG